MSFDPDKITTFAKTDARGQNMPFGIKASDRTRHMYVIGKTGMGKSTLLENIAVQDIKEGQGMAFIDPHGATAETLLDYIPEERKDDVLYFAPFDAENPVAFNVMEDVGPDKRHLVVSGLMSVFKKIWVDAWSARMEYILQNTLLALLEYPDSTLLGVNRMLSEKHYRKQVIDNISDPAVKSFWVDEFLNYNERYMQEAGDSIKNKIGQFTANPLIRNIIGQPKSSFNIREMMDQQKIIIMNLSKGLVGESNANLLGSMLTTRIYLAAMSRADLSQQEMKAAPNFYFFVDEFQSFANATFADILSEARKYKLNLTIAHQYIEQMEEEVKNAVFGNVGTIVSFRVGPFDAEVLETIFAPKFYAVDICNLGFAQIYLTLMIDGIGSPPFSATTLPPIENQGTSCRDMVIHASRQQFAKPRAEVEAAITAWHAPSEGEQGGGKKTAPAGKGGDRPHQKPRQDGGGQRSERPPQRSEGGGKGQKNLDELRSVLAGLSHAEGEKPKSKSAERSKQDAPERTRGARSETTESSGKHELREPEADARPPKPKADIEKPAPKKPKPKSADSAAELKDALAGLLAKQDAPMDKQPVADVSSKKTAPRHKQTPQKRIESRPARPESSSAHAQSTAPKTVAQIPSPQQAAVAHVARTAEATSPPSQQPHQQLKATPPVQEKAAEKDPFDPKVLERMMRVKTDDRTPLK